MCCKIVLVWTWSKAVLCMTMHSRFYLWCISLFFSKCDICTFVFVFFYNNQYYQNNFWTYVMVISSFLLKLFVVEEITEPVANRYSKNWQMRDQPRYRLTYLHPTCLTFFIFSELGHISNISSAYHIMPFTVFTRSGQRGRKQKSQKSVLGNDLKTTPRGCCSVSQIHKGQSIRYLPENCTRLMHTGWGDAW